jgi:hypothetical protein
MRPYLEPTRLPPAVKKAVRGFRQVTAPIRPLPDFLIIGAARCGTTSLYRYLTEHPCIAPAFRKEVSFFDVNFRRGLSWYRAQFPSAVYRRYTEARYGLALTGEASPYYLFHPASPARVAATIPGARLLVLLRNPVERAYSHYYLQVRQGREPLRFEDAIAREAERLAGEREKMLAVSDYESIGYRRYSYLARGLYADQLGCWMKMFPKEDFLIVRTEDLEADPGKILAQAFRFLNVPQYASSRFAKYNNGSYPPMNPTTRQRLVEYYEPHNRRLEELVGREFHWDP